MGKKKVINHSCRVDRIEIGDVSSDKRLVRDEAIVSVDKKYIYFGSKGNWTLKLSDPVKISDDDNVITFRHLENPTKVFSCHFDNNRQKRRMTARAQTQQENNKRLLEEFVTFVSQRLHKKNNNNNNKYKKEEEVEEQQQSIMRMGRVSSRRTFTPKTKKMSVTTSTTPFSSSTGRRTYSKKYGKKSTRSLGRVLDRDFFQEDDIDSVMEETHSHQEEEEVDREDTRKRKAKSQSSKPIGKRLKKMVSDKHVPNDDLLLSDAESEDFDVKEETTIPEPNAYQFDDEEEEVDDDELSHPSLKSETSSQDGPSKISTTKEVSQKNDKDDVLPLSPQVTTEVVSTSKTSVTTVTDEEEGNIPSPPKPDTTKKTTSIMSFFTGVSTTKKNSTIKKTVVGEVASTIKSQKTIKTPPATPQVENMKQNSTLSTDNTQSDEEVSTKEQSSTKKERLDISIMDSLQRCKPANASQTISIPAKTTASVTPKLTSQNKSKVTPFRRVSLNRAAKNVTHESPAKRDLKTYFSDNTSIKNSASPEKKPKIATAKETSPKNPYKKTEQKTAFAGLYNLGNTCYLNSSLQILFSTIGFLQELHDYKKNCSEGKESLPLTTALLTIAKSAGALPTNDTHCRISNVVDPKKLKQAMDQVSDKFEGYEQRDAHEFLSDLLDSIHEELNQKEDEKEAKENSSSKLLPTDKYFHLNVKVCLTCDNCGYSRSVIILSCFH